MIKIRNLLINTVANESSYDIIERQNLLAMIPLNFFS